MAIEKLAALSLFSALALGCPYFGDPMVDAPPMGETTLAFAYRLQSRQHTPIEAGIWGETIWIISVPEFLPPPRSRAMLEGPGGLYYIGRTKEAPSQQIVLPWEEIAHTYYCNGMDLTYRPPPDDEVPPEGIEVSFACEVLNSFTGKWDRSPDYKKRVVRREKPMDFYVVPRAEDDRWLYGPDNSCTDANVGSGELYGTFYFEARPLPAGDLEVRHGLHGPEGYGGPLGVLEVKGQDQYGPNHNGYVCSYTAPEGIAEPVDIVARFSIYDPWAKERRTRELTFHVSPKE